MDVLPVPASSVPSERVFSSSKMTDAARRSRLTPAMFEVLQVLKFSVKRARLELNHEWRPAQEAELEQLNADPTDPADPAEAATNHLLNEDRNFDDFLKEVLLLE